MADLYEILGVSKNANKPEIKSAYRRLARKYHPDVNKGEKKFEEKFKELQAAYETLNDDYKRQIYDRTFDSFEEPEKYEKPKEEKRDRKTYTYNQPVSPQVKSPSLIFRFFILLLGFFLILLILNVSYLLNSRVDVVSYLKNRGLDISAYEKYVIFFKDDEGDNVKIIKRKSNKISGKDTI